MAVVTAGVHKPGINRAKALTGRQMVSIGFFDDTQCVDVKAHGNSRSFAAAQNSNDAGHAASGALHKLRVSPLLNGTLVLLLKHFIRRDAHTGILFADLVAGQDFIPQLCQLAGND